MDNRTLTMTRGEVAALGTNRVLRNTYLLLALTLAFSAVTAGVSVALGLPHPGLIITLVFPAIGRVDEANPSMLRRIDWLHVASLAVFLGGLQYVLEEGPRHEWFSDEGVAAAAWVSFIAALVFFERSVFTTMPVVKLTAFKRPVDAAAVPPKLFSPITFGNWEKLLSGPFPESLGASAVITIGTVVFTLGLGVPAGYAFARGRFPGRRFLGGWLLFSRMIPPVIFIIPLFMYFHQLRLVNTYQGLILAYMTGLLPFTVWMTASYFTDIPVEIEEAARVDGASRFRAFLVVLPLALPGVLTVGVLIPRDDRGEEAVFDFAAPVVDPD